MAEQPRARLCRRLLVDFSTALRTLSQTLAARLTLERQSFESLRANHTLYASPEAVRCKLALRKEVTKTSSAVRCTLKRLYVHLGDTVLRTRTDLTLPSHKISSVKKLVYMNSGTYRFQQDYDR